MKKAIYLSLVIILISGSCTQEKESPIEGAWQLIGTQSVENGKTETTYPGVLVGKEFKTWSGRNFMFVGRWTEDSTITDNYGFGTYTLDGDKYAETILYHFNKPYEGQTIKMKLELRNDTIFQIYHRLDTAGNPDEKVYSVEKYIRLKQE
jgi:hypothetical protein